VRWPACGTGGYLVGSCLRVAVARRRSGWWDRPAAERSRPAYDQLTRTCAALIGPTPGSSSSHGEIPHTNRVSSTSSSVASALRPCTRRAVARRARTVMRCSGVLAVRSRSRAQWVTWAVLVWWRSSARSSSGAPTISAFNWLIAQVLAVTAACRVTSSTRRLLGRRADAAWPVAPRPALRGRRGLRPARRSCRPSGRDAWAGRPRRPTLRARRVPGRVQRRSCQHP
jgi:hypothetical protein